MRSAGGSGSSTRSLSGSVVVVVAEGVVQQVIENLAIQLGLVLVVGLERGQRRLRRRVARSPCGWPLVAVRPDRWASRCVCKSNMICKPMLDLAQEGVVLFQDRPLLIASGSRSVSSCTIASSVLPVRKARQVAAVEQLQELDHELDVANAAVAGLDVVRVGPFAVRALLDAPLERLDAGDVGPAQIAAINPRLELREKLAGRSPDRRRSAGP